MFLWLQFALCTVVIVYCGSRLSQYGDVIAEKTGMGHTWIGVVLMASVTSLPELIAAISAVAVYDLPNIAVGGLLGSCMFNLLILAALDIGRRQAPLSSLVHQGQVLTAAFGIILLGLTGGGIMEASAIPSIGWIAATSFLLLAIYLLAMRLVFRYEKKRVSEMVSAAAMELRYDHVSSTTAYRRFAAFAVIIVIAATYLPHIADGIALATGLGRTFVGSILVAVATSLPEVIVSHAALRIDAPDLAVGNMLGSNLFNIAILAIADIAFLRGSIFSHVSSTQALTAIAAMVMTATLMVALVYRPKHKLLFVTWESLGIFLVYAVTTVFLYLRR
jgi:cation:H+ antiporter